MTLDLSEGSVFPPGGIFYDGGSNGAVGDALAIHGGDQGVVTYRYDSPNDGTIDMSNYGRVTYMGLEPLVNTGTASDVIFVLPATANIATLTDDGTASNGLTRLSGANFELTDFSNPTGSITILRGNSADTLTIGALPDLTASITIGTAATPFSALMFSGAVTLATDKNLTAFASGLITLNTTSSALATSGVGSISLTTATNILVSTSASIKTVNGALSLSANQTTSTAGNFTGIDIDGGLVQASGTGSVSVLGKGGTNAAGNQRGVRLIKQRRHCGRNGWNGDGHRHGRLEHGHCKLWRVSFGRRHDDHIGRRGGERHWSGRWIDRHEHQQLWTLRVQQRSAFRRRFGDDDGVGYSGPEHERARDVHFEFGAGVVIGRRGVGDRN